MQRVITSGRFTMGEECEALEHEFAAYHGMKYGVAVNSGSSANLISVAAMRQLNYWPVGARIAVPALAWSTTYSPLRQHGLELKPIDCDGTWNAAPEKTSDCNGAIICSILGNPQAWKPPLRYCLEDNCESVGASLDGQLVGTAGTANTFSFYFSHQMSAIEGGMILSNDRDFADVCRILKNHGWTRGVVPSSTFEDEIRFVSNGYNVRPVEMHAAIAREQLRKLDARIRARSANYMVWRVLSDGLPIKHPDLRGRPSLFGIHFCLESREARARLAIALRAAGIDCRPPAGGSLHKQPYGADWRFIKTPNADAIHDTGMMLGLAPFDIGDLIERAVKVMRATL